MAIQNALSDNAVGKSLLAVDGETNAETRRVHSRTRGDVNALSMELVDASGNQVTSFGGTQYADGAVRGTATGTIAMGDDGTNIQALSVDADGKMKMEDMLKELVSRLAFLPSVRGIAADLRVTLLSGTVTTVTTVTTVSGITNIGGFGAQQLVPSIGNANAILSNINNIIV